jgi:hypothetical protein
MDPELHDADGLSDAIGRARHAVITDESLVTAELAFSSGVHLSCHSLQRTTDAWRTVIGESDKERSPGDVVAPSLACGFTIMTGYALKEQR